MRGKKNMNTLNFLDKLRLDELVELQNYVQNNTRKDLKKEIKRLIKEKDEQRKRSLNYRVKLEDISTFTLEDRLVLKRNNINNMQDLVEAKIEKLKGIDLITKESLEWAQSFYDFSGLEEHNDSNKHNIVK